MEEGLPSDLPDMGKTSVACVESMLHKVELLSPITQCSPHIQHSQVRLVRTIPTP